MAFDIALSPAGDLIVSAANDLQGVSGTNLLDQRIRLRLQIARGSWIFDEDGTLGSQLHTTLSQNFDQVKDMIHAYALQALEPMTDEILVENIDVRPSESSGYPVISVRYRPVDTVVDVTTDFATGDIVSVELPTADIGTVE